jgi:H+/gluconate symporter-like permease
MATTFLTGSYAAAANLQTAVVSNTTLAGTGGMQEEVTNLLGAGYVIGSLMNDGTNYIAFMIQKKWN